MHHYAILPHLINHFNDGRVGNKQFEVCNFISVVIQQALICCDVQFTCSHEPVAKYNTVMQLHSLLSWSEMQFDHVHTTRFKNLCLICIG